MPTESAAFACGMARAPFHNLTPEQQQYIDEVTEKNLIS